MTIPRLSRGRKRLLACICVLASVALFVDFDGFFAFTMPNARTMRRMLSTKFLSSDDGRFLSRPLPDGGCQWLPPGKLDRNNAMAPRTLIVSYPGSGKRLTWRMLEAMTGFRAGDDWDLSEEGKEVLTMKTSYPHPEGVWTWGNRFFDSSVVLLIRNPRWAIPSYQTMRYELDYSRSWKKSYVRRPFTYTERGDLDDWVRWRGDTWPHGPKSGQFGKQLDLWGWYIDFWMNDGLRRDDGFGNPTQDYHCRQRTQHMKTCKPKVIIDFDTLYNDATGEAEAEKLVAAIETNKNPIGQGTPMIPQENRKCVFEQTVEKRLTEERWDNSGRDGYGMRQEDKNFTFVQLECIKMEIERLIGTYTNATLGWDTDPMAKDLVFHLRRYLDEIETEIEVTYPYTWWPTSSPTDMPVPTVSPTLGPTTDPTVAPTPQPTCAGCPGGMRGNFDNSNFRSAVMGFLYDTDATIEEFGPINCWDVSGVTDMAGLFAREMFNKDISCWDTSNVVTMRSMFHGTDFNQDISGWDVSNVYDMTDMFRASDFNQDISAWDVSHVISFFRTFNSAKFNQDISSWDVSSSGDMRQMFLRAGEFNQDLCAWGSKLNGASLMIDMFVDSGCGLKDDPSLATNPAGPFCFTCA